MKDKLLGIYYRIRDILIDYRYKVDGKAGVIFAYYFTMSIVPIFSLLAFFASLFDLDLTIIENFLQTYISDDMASMVVGRLVRPSFSFTTIFVLVISIYVVSRCIRQIYNVSKNMYPPVHERTWYMEFFYSLVKTIGVFFLLVIMIIFLTTMPFVTMSSDSTGFISADDAFMYVIFFGILWLLYKIIPDVHVNFQDVTVGSAGAALMMWILVKILTFYFSKANYTTVYGSLATVVIIMMAFSLIAEVIYIGLYLMFEAHMLREIRQLKRELHPKPKKRRFKIIDEINDEIVGEAMDQEELDMIMRNLNLPNDE